MYGAIVSKLIPIRPVSVEVANVTFSGFPGLSPVTVSGVIIISNHENFVAKQVENIQISLLGNLEIGHRTNNELTPTVKEIFSFSQLILDRSHPFSSKVTMDAIPTAQSRVSNAISGQIPVTRGRILTIPPGQRVFIPITLEVPQMRSESMAPSLALWRTKDQYAIRYNLHVSVGQNGVRGVINHDQPIWQRLYAFDASDIAIYLRKSEADTIITGTTKADVCTQLQSILRFIKQNFT
ncbi:hypothetical protein HK096_007456 [Nowakowskiella sp. JEL0078]|nr:hypothetical protein HK096_007456 [Nowakowskiella sp. JEL0078]